MKFIWYLEIVIFILALCFFFIGTHNIDISHNMSLIESWKYDENLGGQIADSRNIYMIGARQVWVSVLCFIGSFFLSLISKLRKEKDLKY